MPTQPRKLFYHHWHAYTGGVRRRPFIAFDWAGPSVAMVTGAWGMNEELTWGGPSVGMNPGAFTSAIETQSLDGAQYVDGALSFTGATTIVLDSSVYPVVGNFVLFDYGSFAGGQAELNARVTVDASGLPLEDFVSLEDQPSQSRVVLELGSKPTNGKQFVDGNLEFAGATTVYLDADLYATPGTYELFEVTGTITGLGNLTCVSSAGWTVSSISAAGGIVSVTLT